MALKYWQGNEGNVSTPQTNVGKWDYDDSGGGYTDSNWRDPSTGNGVAKPATGDEIFIDNRAFFNSTLGTEGRYQDIINGDQTGDPNLLLFYVASNFDGNIGTSGVPIELGCASGSDGRFIFHGTGVAYFMITQGATADSEVTELIINSDGGTLYIKSEVNNGSYLCKLVKVLAYDGTLKICTEADADTIHIGDIIVINSTAVVTIGTLCKKTKTSNEYMNIQQINGILTSDSPIANYEGYAGTFNWGTSGAVAQSDVNLYGNIKTFGSVNLICAPKNSGTANLLQFFAYGGTIDASQALNANIPKTIGSGSNEISEVYPGATVKLNNGNGNISFLGTSKIRIFGGSVEPPFNKQIAW
jgi:hypothetical protein